MPLLDEGQSEKEQILEPNDIVASKNLDAENEEEQEEDEIPEGYDGPYKMVFVVNSELGMGVGKVAAQVAHAALGLYRLLMENSGDNNQEKMSPLDYWELIDGEKKIVVKCDNSQQLHDLMAKAKGKGLEFYLVTDAGLTQISPGSNTVLSIFGRDEIINQVTGKLKLL